MPDLPEASETEIDRVPVADLTSRYSIKSAALYKRFDELGIKPLRSGRTSSVTGEHLKVLDELHQHLQRGGGFADFPKLKWFSSDANPESEQGGELVYQTSGRELESSTPSQLARESPSLAEALINLNLKEILTGALVNAGKILFPPPLPPARRGLQLAYLRELKEAAEEGWLVSTSDVASLLGVSKSTIASKGQRFTACGFVFVRAGRGFGNQIAWRVAKAPIAPIDFSDTES